MIRNIFTLFVICMLAGCQSRNANSGKQIPDRPDPSKLGIVVVNIQGMSCTGCEETITGSVAALDGINACRASYVKGIAKVEFDTTLISTADIKHAIEKTGYKVTGFSFVSDTTGVFD